MMKRLVCLHEETRCGRERGVRCGKQATAHTSCSQTSCHHHLCRSLDGKPRSDKSKLATAPGVCHGDGLPRDALAGAQRDIKRVQLALYGCPLNLAQARAAGQVTGREGKRTGLGQLVYTATWCCSRLHGMLTLMPP